MFPRHGVDGWELVEYDREWAPYVTRAKYQRGTETRGVLRALNTGREMLVVNGRIDPHQVARLAYVDGPVSRDVVATMPTLVRRHVAR